MVSDVVRRVGGGLVGAIVVMVVALGGSEPVRAGAPVEVLDDDQLQRFGLTSADSLADLAPAAPFAALGFSEVEQQLVRGLTTPIDAPRYGFGDDQDGPPVIDPPGTDPVGMGSLQVVFQPGQLPAPGMTDEMYIVSQGSLDAGSPTTLIWVEFGSTFDVAGGLAVNEGGVLSRPSRDAWASTFDADTFNGGNLFPTATYSPDPFALSMLEYEPPQSFPANPDIPGFVMRSGNYLVVGVDTASLTADDPLDTIGYGFHMHISPEPFTPGVVSGYPPPRARTPESFRIVATNDPLRPGTFCCLAEETPEETPPAEETPAETPDEAPEETPLDETAGEEEPPVDVPEPGETLPDGGNLESGSFRRWVPITVIILGVAIVVGGFWIYYRTRERRRPGTGAGAGDGETPPPEEEDEGGDPRDVGIPGPVEHTTCDWELHYWTGTQWQVLRPAPFPAHKCCIYKVRVETKIKRHEQAAKFRQDVRPQRLYIPDFDFAWRGMDFDAHTSTRSGPQGRLDWMQGLGDPLEQADEALAEPYWQRAQGEEPPEVATHLAHDETTRIDIALESRCTDPVNTYKSSGDSSLSIMATHECTNDDPAPECPVELNAFGWQWGEVWGELNWIVYDEQGTDPDELERLMVVRRGMDPERRSDTAVKVPVHRTWDSHDHEVRDRLTYEAGDYDSGSGAKESMSWTTWVDTEVELDAGQIVPMHVWPTTERVSAHIEQRMTHSVKVSGEMKKGDCASTGCCTGHPNHVCQCAPEFELRVDSTGSRIDVDGKTFRLQRDPASADRRSPPAPASPAPYRAWKLI